MKQTTIAVIGAGPAGAALAFYLAQAGARVGIFTSKNRPELTVGESLVPAVIPFLREMGVEEEVKSYSTFKPGASFFMRGDEELSFDFTGDPKRTPPYAYNVPRKEFDQTLFNAAIKAGAQVFYLDAQIVPDRETRRLKLSDDTLAATNDFFHGEPDFIVDASGRRRLVAKLLDLPTVTGKRRDSVLFAHLDHTQIVRDGNIHVDRLERGWAWRIPLPNRVSVGIVAPADYVASMGADIETQYDRLLEVEPRIKGFLNGGKRLTRVFRYSNYNLHTHRLFGPNWALTGDAAGFIDPVFSSGLVIGLSGAKYLAKALVSNDPKALEKYQIEVIDQLQAWEKIVDRFYDGHFFSAMEAGQEIKKTLFGSVVYRHIFRHVTRVMTGTATTVPYSRGLLHLVMNHGLGNKNPEEVRIL